MSKRITKKDLERELKFIAELTDKSFKAECSPVGNWWALYQVNDDSSLTRVSLPDPLRAGLSDFVLRLRAFRAGLVYAERGF